jgi:acyl dehydratase
MLPDEVKQLIGKSAGVRVFEVERGAIRRFADAVDDPNPLYRDDEYARNSRYGSIIAPPGFFGWPSRQPRGAPLTAESSAELGVALAKAGYLRVLDGGMEYEFSAPIRAGDTLAASTIIKDIREREGRTGSMVFLIMETTYTNQNGDIVAKARSTSIHR